LRKKKEKGREKTDIFENIRVGRFLGGGLRRKRIWKMEGLQKETTKRATKPFPNQQWGRK